MSSALAEEYAKNADEITRLEQRQIAITTELAKVLCDVKVGDTVIETHSGRRCYVRAVCCWRNAHNQFCIALEVNMTRKSGKPGTGVRTVYAWHKEAA